MSSSTTVDLSSSISQEESSTPAKEEREIIQTEMKMSDMVSHIAESEIDMISPKELLHENVIKCLREYAHHVDAGTASTLHKIMVARKESIVFESFLSLEKNVSANKTLTDLEYGGVVLRYLRAQMAAGGRLFAMLVLSCIKIGDYMNSGANEEEIIRLEAENVALERLKPDEAQLEAEMKVEILTKDNELKMKYKSDFETKRVAAKKTTEGYYESESFELYKLELEDETSVIKVKHLTKNLLEKKEFKEKIQPQIDSNNSLIKQKKLNASRSSRVNSVFVAYGQTLTLLTEDIKKLVTPHAAIVGKLKGDVDVGHLDEPIRNPFEASNVGGMYYLLNEHFGKADLKSVMEEFNALVDRKLTTADVSTPAKLEAAFNRANDIHHKWLRKGLYEMLTPDLLQTGLFIGAMDPESEARRLIVLHLMAAVQAQASGSDQGGSDFKSVASAKGDTVAGQNMFMFNTVGKFITNVLPSIGNLQKAGGNAKSTGFTSGSPQRNARVSPGYERAAVAEVVEKKPGDKELPKEMFTNEVKRDANYWIISTVNGEYVPYTATKVQCDKCGPGKMCADRKKCYWKQCLKCGLFGLLRIALCLKPRLT